MPMPSAMPQLPNLSRLQIALLVSVAAHAALLALKVGAPQAFDRVFEDTPLAVVLVNGSTADRPNKPQALAQANLLGGGNGGRGLATTPLPVTAAARPGDAAQDQARELAREEQLQRELISSVRGQIVQLQHVARAQPDPKAAHALEEQRRRLMDMLGAIERRIEQQESAPRRRFVGPDTRSVPYALYYDRMRQKIEHEGTVDFPQLGGRKLYGRLVMAITVDAGGRLLGAKVVRGSGDERLDRMARAIVEAAQPFGRFTPAMRTDADQIVVVAGFDFTHDTGLETQLQAPARP